MSQPILPLIPSGATQVGELLSIVRENEHTKYYMGAFQIGINKTSDKATFKAKICELIFCGVCRNKDVLKSLAISSSSLKRWMRQYKEKGADSFHAASATRGGAVLTDTGSIPIRIEPACFTSTDTSAFITAEKQNYPDATSQDRGSA